MKPTLCSRCKKNVAVVFITRLDPNGQSSHNEGLCLKCARELNIRPVTDMIEKMGLSDEELEGLTNEMMSAFDGTESMQDLIGNITESLRDVAGERDDDEDEEEEDEEELISYECPHCGHEIVFKASDVDFDEDYLCPACGKPVFPELDEEDEEDEDKE